MKKLVAILTGFIIAGATVTTVSAASHEVEKGESLWKIANEYNTTVEQLVDINDLKSTVIHPKQIIEIDGADGEEYYVVQQGDTLNAISNEKGVSVSNLKSWNNLSSDLIITGQELALNGAKAEANEAPAANESSESKQASKNETEASESNKQVNETNTQKTEAKTETNEQQTKSQQADGKTISVESTAYTAGCAGCSGITATGMNLNENPNAKVIAVDPNVIPLGTEVYVEGYGYAVAADTGGAINGNKIDVHVPTKDEAYSWGRKTVNVTIVK
ncbi:3D domain-containing protein [Virgibacillus ainsalahensis]